MAKRHYQVAYGRHFKDDKPFGMTEGFMHVSAKNRRAAESKVRRKTGMSIMR